MLINDKLKYSLLVPCYNAAAHVDKFISHLSGLQKPFDEVLFYDDASTDGTAEMISAAGYQVIRGDVNKGPGFGRNLLAEAATGDYFHFHDIDDEMLPEYLKSVALIAEAHPYDVILCNVDWYSAAKQQLLFCWKYSNEEIIKQPLCYTITNPIGGINGLYKKKKFMLSGGFNTSAFIWEDADLHVKLAAAGADFYVLEQVLCIAIRSDNSISSNQAKGWLTRFEFLQGYFEKFTDHNVRLAIGKQAQVAASNLILTNQYNAAKAALQLSEKCGLKVPDNTNPGWVVLKLLMPSSIRIALRMIQLKNAFNQ